MLESLKEYPNNLRKLFSYLKTKSIEPIVFLKMTQEQQLGYYLMFLAKEGINIEVNDFGSISYFMQLGELIEKQEWNEALVIFERSYSKDTDLLKYYNELIIKSFKRLENPF